MTDNAVNKIKPKWHTELEIFNHIKPLTIIEGNIFDKYRYVSSNDNTQLDDGAVISINAYLSDFYKSLGYKYVIFFNHIKGFYVESEDNTEEDQLALNELTEICNFINHNRKFATSNVSVNNTSGCIDCTFSGRGADAANIVNDLLHQKVYPVVVIMNFASRYIVGPNNMQQDDVQAFTRLQIAVTDAEDVPSEENGQILKNSLVMMVNRVNDLPTWFYYDNPLSKTITIDTPSKEERRQFIDESFDSFFDSNIYRSDLQKGITDEEINRIKERFVGLTAGFTYLDFLGLSNICYEQKFHIHELNKVVDLYRYGVQENPWLKLSPKIITDAEHSFQRRVQGQNQAIVKTLDVIKRAITGLDGLQHSSHTKPKGVLFFAGPTGTGKTETAKTLAQVLFGDESRCIRFDMSEFSQSHSDQRLLGAPPGYVGYEAGGQLTNAVRANPFSILLFDEIEKAHPSILDKFLQILEDGRMTDGQGKTVYFSECVIVFTSNLGIYVEKPNPETGLVERVQNVTSKDTYEDTIEGNFKRKGVKTKVRKAIEDYFKFKLNRPEILNRIGENIVVFDFIRPDVANGILTSLINKITKELEQSKNITLALSPKSLNTLQELAGANLDNGGRGIGNVVENYLINPLARYMFDNNVLSEAHITITSIDTKANPAVLTCEVQR